MDTKRALIVILVLLILMNIALASYIVVLGGRSEHDVEIGEYTIDILSQRNIAVMCRIPSETPKTGTLTLKGMRFGESSTALLESQTGGTYTVDETGKLIYMADAVNGVSTGDFGRTEVEGIARDFMDKIGLQRNEFILDIVNETGDNIYVVRYLNIDDAGVGVFDSYVEMNITPAGVVWAEISVVDVGDINRGAENGLPVGTIMLTHLVSEGRDITVDEIKYGYYRKEEGSDEAVLSWRIRVSDGNDRFFDLDTGLEITPISDILEDNNIKFECKLPVSPIMYPSASYRESEISSQDIAMMQTVLGPDISIDENDIITFSMSGQNNAEYDLDENLASELSNVFIEKIGLDSTDYIIDSITENDDGSFELSYLYKDREGMLHFHNYINLNVTKSGVAGAEFRENSIVADTNNILAGDDIGTILFNNLDTEDGREYIITGIDAGYLRVPGDSADALAVWRVSFKDGTTRWYSAASGSEIKPEE